MMNVMLLQDYYQGAMLKIIVGDGHRHYKNAKTAGFPPRQRYRCRAAPSSAQPEDYEELRRFDKSRALLRYAIDRLRC